MALVAPWPALPGLAMHTTYGQFGQPANMLNSAALCGAMAALALADMGLGGRCATGPKPAAFGARPLGGPCARAADLLPNVCPFYHHSVVSCPRELSLHHELTYGHRVEV